MRGACAQDVSSGRVVGKWGLIWSPEADLGDSHLCPAVKDRYRDRGSGDDSSSESDSSDERVVSFRSSVPDRREAFNPPTLHPDPGCWGRLTPNPIVPYQSAQPPPPIPGGTDSALLVPRGLPNAPIPLPRQVSICSDVFGAPPLSPILSSKNLTIFVSCCVPEEGRLCHLGHLASHHISHIFLPHCAA